MSQELPERSIPLKQTMNPKNRGNIVEFTDRDIAELSEDELETLRVINTLEEELDRLSR
jgi:hypothetical protein